MGIISGFSHGTILQSFGLVIADIFIKVFKCISLPIIALSIIVSLAQYNTVQSMQKLWKRTILYTISTTLLAAGIAFILYLIIRPKSIYTITHAESTAAPLTQHSYIGHIAQLIPSNIFSPFLEHQVMGVLLVGIVVGIAIRYISDTDARNTITSFFKGTHGIFLTITGWVVKVIPLGLYGFITSTVTQLHEGKNFESIGGYLCIIVLANLVQGFIILPAWLSLNGILPFKTMKSMMPALSLAFFSKSSVGTLPVTIETAEKNVGINSKISRFVLPLCTTLNMNGCAAFIFTTVIYLMQNHTGNIGLSTMLIWIVVATITAIGNAGVPMGCFFLSASLLVSMDVPITLLGIILPFYSIIDMIETALNVWSDTCVTVVINKKHKIGKL
jgi:Na+/H+-dicarboxylate symporter